MSNSDDLSHIFAPLRSNATQTELADEAAHVEAMAQARITSKGRISMLTNSKARVATLIAAGIIGFGGVAAAGPGGLSQTLEVPPEETVATTTATTVPEELEENEGPETTETTEVPETSIVTTTEVPPAETDESEKGEEPEDESDPEVATVPIENDPDTNFDETTCLDGNHGNTVSAVASGDEEYAGVFADVEVRDAAHSKCGKKADSEEDGVPESERSDSDDEDNDDDDDDDDDDEKPEKDKKPGKGHSSEKSNNGRGKGPKGD
jgi:hypothetical protein